MGDMPIMTSPRLLHALLVVLAVDVVLAAQSPPSFEVASVKANKLGEPQSVPQMQPGGRVTLTNRTLRYFVQFAYSALESPLHDFQIVGGPDWADKDRFDVTAKMGGNPPPVPATANLARIMLRGVLAERFQLKVRMESKEVPVYALVLARPNGQLGAGLRLRQDSCERFVPPPGEPDLKGSSPLCGYLRGGQGTINYRGVPISSLFRPNVLGRLDRLVIDRTNLQGIFDIDLTWAVDTTASDNAPSIFTAVQEQLGLKLEPTRAPVEVLVIESAEKPTPD
jgi:uncharacterized protein (TIGR03435 family)